MAYAELAGLPPITGLYTSIMCLLGYAVFGPSRILVLGPDSSLGPMIAATILPLIGSGGDPKKAVAIASLLALIVAAIMILAATAKLGFIADLLSNPTMIGYMNGLALTILIGQLPKLFGFSIDADNLIQECTGFVEGLADGKAIPAAVAVGVAGIVLILVLQRWLPKIPAVLVMVVLSIRSGCVRPGRTRSQSGGNAAQGLSSPHDSQRGVVRPGPDLHRSYRHCHCLACRHDLHRVIVRRTHGTGNQSATRR
jgi:Sulfate permease and related transporters (MFS superfamily)